MKKTLLFLLICFSTILHAQIAGNKVLDIGVYGSETFMDCGDIAVLNNANAYTIEMWANLSFDGKDYITIFRKEEASETRRIKVNILKTGQIVIMQSDGDGAYAQTGVGVYPLKGWHHFALVYNGQFAATADGAMMVYVDGVKQAIGDTYFNKKKTANIDAPFFLGTPTQGQYDEVRIWNKVLSGETINKWKNYKVLDAHPDKANLAVYYDFENATGNTVPDKMGHYPATFNTVTTGIQVSKDLKIYEEVGELTVAGAVASQFTGDKYVGEERVDVISFNVNTVGVGDLFVTGVDFSLSGTTSLRDISYLKLYSTGEKATVTDESVTLNYSNIVAADNITLRAGENAGQQKLIPGNNFFVISAKLRSSAASGNKVDASIQKIYFSNGTSITPTNNDPDGNINIRQIDLLDATAYGKKMETFNNKFVFGWLPYFNIGFADKIDWNALTHISPIGFQIDKGGYVPTFEDQMIDQKWPWVDLINTAHKKGVKVIASITGNVRDGGNTAFYQDFFADSQKMRSAALVMADFVAKYKLDGINMDIEEFYNTVPNVGAKYNEFCSYIRQALDDKSAELEVETPYELSIATYPGNDGSWDFPGMLRSAHYLTIMMYNIGSTWTCPLPNAKQRIQQYWLDLGITPDKLVIGWPYYGNLFKNGTNAGTATIGNLALYSNRNDIVWDANSQCNKYTFTGDDGSTMVAYVEDIKSLRLKYEYSKEKDFKGIAIWALGQDAGVESQTYPLIREFYDKTFDPSKEVRPFESEDSPYKVFPTLVTNTINIQSEIQKTFNVQIFNSIGIALKTISVNDAQCTIDLSNLTPSTYYVVISDGNKTYGAPIIKR